MALFPFVMEAWDNRQPTSSERCTSQRFTHTHGGNELILICDLGTTVIHKGIPTPAPPGTLFLHRHAEVHGVIRDGSPCRCLVINYEPDETFEAAMPNLALDAWRTWRLDDRQMAAYLDLFTRLQAEIDTKRPHRAEAASAWMRLLLIMIARFDAPQAASQPGATMEPVDPEVRRLRQAIDLHRQGSLLGPLSDSVENYDSLRHRFRRIYGESPNQMLARLRIEKACGVLISSDDPMSEIARHVGYTRQHEFARAFRRVVGCTPTAFRRQHRHR